MKRRNLTIGPLLAGGAHSARAEEPAKQHRIAIVIPAGSIAGISDTGDRLYRAIFQELRRLGYVEGQNLTVERYSGEGRPKGFPDLARDVAARNPEVIVAITNPLALAVRAATGTIPVVWIGIEAIGVGLVRSFAHPGRNITGVSLYDAEFYAKRLQILKEALPSASRVVWLIIKLIEKGRLPAIYGNREYVEAGGLMAYEGGLDEAGRRMADDVHEILNGAKPGDIPIYQATRFGFVINLNAAKTLGLTIPPTLLGTADEVIE